MREAKSPIAVFVLLATIGHPAGAFADQPLPAANNAFGFSLFKQLAKDQPSTNISISPYSTATLLHMIGNGAAGKTKTEMQQVLGTIGLSAADVNAANKNVAQSLASTSTHVMLTTANAVWYRP